MKDLNSKQIECSVGGWVGKFGGIFPWNLFPIIRLEFNGKQILFQQRFLECAI
jgi:hypothetical protein